jgi:DNA-binding CsgD family transcriptional regulator
MGAKVPEGCQLTPRQFQVLQLLGDGHKPKEIATDLGISPSTVHTLTHDMYRTLGCHSVTQAIVVAGRSGWLGWVTPDDPTPLANEHPWLAAYLKDFERSRWPHEPDARAIVGMDLALAGHRNTMKP